jgi:hypothetical protein
MTKSNANLVGILEENVFALGLLENQISDRSNDTPTVGEVDIVLRGEIARLRSLGTEDDVSGSVAGSGTRNPSERRDRASQFPVSKRRRKVLCAHPIFN